MILTRYEIADLLQQGLLSFTPPLDAWQNQPHAVDLRLGTTFYVPKTWHITPEGRKIINVDVAEPNEHYEKVEISPGQVFELAPGEAIIASTLEKIELSAPDIMAVLYPRSSVNRKGLSVDLTGIIDVHYKGHLMIPLWNRTQSQIIRLMPGERICQVVFERLARGLSAEDGLMHGKKQAKYQNAGEKTLTGVGDCQNEVDFIKKGDLFRLKKHEYEVLDEKNEKPEDNAEKFGIF